MNIEEKIEVNKMIKKYEGINSFLLSLQKQFKTNKNLTKEEFNGKSVKILSDRQYEVAKKLIDKDGTDT
jgi:hypothetical protein